MSRIQDAICVTILLTCGVVTLVIMAALFMHSIQVDEPTPCVTESGHKEVPCK